MLTLKGLTQVFGEGREEKAGLGHNRRTFNEPPHLPKGTQSAANLYCHLCVPYICTGAAA